MKALARTVLAVAAALMITALPVLAEEGTVGPKEENATNRECLLVAKNCPTDSIQERIERIQGEINKGTAVYSNDELNRLNRELDEAQKLFEYQLTGGGSA